MGQKNPNTHEIIFHFFNNGINKLINFYKNSYSRTWKLDFLSTQTYNFNFKNYFSLVPNVSN